MLELYKNIKARREDLGLTQAQLAELAGYADKTMISKIEKGSVDLSQSKIEVFAKALKTTPAKLMGWEKQSSVESGFLSIPIPDEILKPLEEESRKAYELRRLSEAVNAHQQAVQKNEHPVYYTDSVTARIAQKVFEDESFRILFDAAEDSTPENIKLAAEMLRRLKEK